MASQRALLPRSTPPRTLWLAPRHRGGSRRLAGKLPARAACRRGRCLTGQHIRRRSLRHHRPAPRAADPRHRDEDRHGDLERRASDRPQPGAAPAFTVNSIGGRGGRSRTCGIRLWRPALWPSELHPFGAPQFGMTQGPGSKGFRRRRADERRLGTATSRYAPVAGSPSPRPIHQCPSSLTSRSSCRCPVCW